MGQRLRNGKHEKFAREVAALTPLATAYREAGFGGDLRWHPFNASKLSNKPKVKARIEELRIEFERMSAIHLDYVRHMLLRTIEADPRDLYESDPSNSTGKRVRLRPISELPRHLTTAISRLKIDPATGAPVDVLFGNKNEAAATLLRSLPGGSAERTATLEDLVLASMTDKTNARINLQISTGVPRSPDEATSEATRPSIEGEIAASQSAERLRF